MNPFSCIGFIPRIVINTICCKNICKQAKILLLYLIFGYKKDHFGYCTDFFATDDKVKRKAMQKRNQKGFHFFSSSIPNTEGPKKLKLTDFLSILFKTYYCNKQDLFNSIS